MTIFILLTVLFLDFTLQKTTLFRLKLLSISSNKTFALHFSNKKKKTKFQLVFRNLLLFLYSFIFFFLDNGKLKSGFLVAIKKIDKFIEAGNTAKKKKDEKKYSIKK